jgi:hypothetical protein
MENNITAFDQALLFNAYPAEILNIETLVHQFSAYTNVWS